MKKLQSNLNFWIIISLILGAVLFRIISNQLNLFNFSPMIAIAIFSGAKLKDKKWAMFIPFVTMFIGDAILAYLNNYHFLHSSILFTYGSLLLIFGLGGFLSNSKIVSAKTIGVSLFSSLVFFVITNLGVWLFSNLYALTVDGLILCFTKAIPFNKVSWLGDLIYLFLMLGIYQLVSNPKNENIRQLAWQESKKI